MKHPDFGRSQLGRSFDLQLEEFLRIKNVPIKEALSTYESVTGLGKLSGKVDPMGQKIVSTAIPQFYQCPPNIHFVENNAVS